MTDKKQIEEMAKCMCSSYESNKGCNTCPTNWCYADECATMAFCNGYRKIPENAVVLSKEMYELYEHHKNNYEVGKRDGSKERTREILKYLMQFEGYADVAGEELAKQYGVEVE